MSSRALRRLREEQLKEMKVGNALSEEDDDTEDEEEEEETKKGAAFSMLGFDDDSDSDSDSDDDDDDDDDDDGEEEEGAAPKPSTSKSKNVSTSRKGKKAGNEDDDEEEDEEDIDAILEDFRDASVTEGNADHGSPAVARAPTASSVLLSGMDARDLDVDQTVRRMLGGGGGGNKRTTTVFAPPNWGDAEGNADADNNDNRQRRQQRRNQRGGRRRVVAPKPPSYVGGGMGMKASTTADPPFPYSTEDGHKDNAIWHSFTHSDAYQRTEDEYDSLVASADANALVAFVADRPFHARSALQLAMVFFRTNNNADRGHEMLRRALLVLETAADAGLLDGDSSSSDRLVDADAHPSNETLFHALFRYAQTASVQGCVETSLATARLLLSLDPLRDPMGVLLTLDYYALAATNHEFVIRLVESDTIQIHHRTILPPNDDDDVDGDENGEQQPPQPRYVHHRCALLDMPNWAYAHALALRRREAEDPDASPRADDALRAAVAAHPSVVPRLLEANGVDWKKDRSFRVDWARVMPALDERIAEDRTRFDPRHRQRATDVFVKRSCALWKPDDVAAWLFRAVEKLVEGSSTTKDEDEDEPPPTTERSTRYAALARYDRCDPEDYEDRFAMLPGDANPLDENLVAPALAYDPRRRLLRRRQAAAQRMGMGANADEVELQRLLLEQIRRDNNVVVVDPAEAPLAELFLRSLLPWNAVDGVPPPARHGGGGGGP